MKPQESVDVAGGLYRNWTLDAVAPVLFNEQADTHSIIAWCWGDVSQAHDLSLVALANPDAAYTMACVVESRLAAVKGMLEVLGDRTRPPRGGAV